MRICVFGDSIVWGAWDEKYGGWVERLQHYLNWDKEDYEAVVYNLGISANTTSNLLQRFECEAKAREPEVVLIQIGKNDAVYIDSEDKPMVEFELFRTNVLKLITLARKFTSKIIFVGGMPEFDESKTTPVSWINHYFTNKRIKMYIGEIEKICKKEDIHFINLASVLTKKDFWKNDVMHPNSKGHKKICDAVVAYLLKNRIIC